MSENLSPREIEVLQLIAEGNTNKQIASRLGIAEVTTKNHITSIILKLDAYNRTHAVVLALRQGLLTIDKIKT